MKLANIPLVQQMIDSKYISVRKHPEFELYIYNYTKQTSAESVWNEATEQCRGIICDKEMNVIARPFAKFYNYEELKDLNIAIPDLPFEVYEKLDGSLGILYFYNDKPYISTRGSFDSSQAKHATKILYEKYSDKFYLLDKSKTYLFEIIYDDGVVRNNLIVDYGNTDDIFLIAVIDTETGKEDDIYDYKHIFKTTTKYDNVEDFLLFRSNQDGNNREGFVIKFSNNFRMKLKFEEYIKAHCAQHCLNKKIIFNSIIEGNINSVKDRIKSSLSEEACIYFDEIVKSFYDKYKDIENYCKSVYRNNFSSKLDEVEYIKSCKYSPVLFSIRDGKNYSHIIWSYIRKEL